MQGRASRCTSGCRLPCPLPRENLPHGEEKRRKGLSEFSDGRGEERRGRRQERCFRPPPRLYSNPGQQWGSIVWVQQRQTGTSSEVMLPPAGSFKEHRHLVECRSGLFFLLPLSFCLILFSKVLLSQDTFRRIKALVANGLIPTGTNWSRQKPRKIVKGIYEPTSPINKTMKLIRRHLGETNRL